MNGVSNTKVKWRKRWKFLTRHTWQISFTDQIQVPGVASCMCFERARGLSGLGRSAGPSTLRARSAGWVGWAAASVPWTGRRECALLLTGIVFSSRTCLTWKTWMQADLRETSTR